MAVPRDDFPNISLHSVDVRLAPFRYGLPRLLIEPFERAHTSGDDPQLLPAKAALFQTILNNLRAKGFEVQRHYLEKRNHSGRSEGDAITTLVLEGDIKNTAMSKIEDYLLEAHRRCTEAGMNVTIELADQCTWDGIKAFAIAHDDTRSIEGWREVHSLLVRYLQQVRKERGYRWHTLDLLHRGYENEQSKCPATIVLGSPDAEVPFWWHEGIESMRALANYQFNVQVVYSHKLGTTDEGTAGIEAYETPIKMGGSVSRANGRGGGTVGGQVRLQTAQGVDMGFFALTNHHVAVSKEIQAANGIRNSLNALSAHLRSSAPYYVSPSDEEHDARRERCLEDLKFWLSYLDKKGTKPAQGTITTAKAQHEKIQRDLSAMENVDRTIGHLAASSGRRTIPSYEDARQTENEQERGRKLDWLMDWAIIGLRNDKPAANVLNKPPRSKVETVLRDQMPANEWEQLRTRRENLVAFRGASSGWVFGVMNPVNSILNRFATGNIVEDYGLSEEEPGYSWALVNRKSTDPAVKGGDSGSVVILDEHRVGEEARWLGLVFAEGGSGAAYVQPIELVFKDIEDITGLKVMEPVFIAFDST